MNSLSKPWTWGELYKTAVGIFPLTAQVPNYEIERCVDNSWHLCIESQILIQILYVNRIQFLGVVWNSEKKRGYIIFPTPGYKEDEEISFVRKLHLTSNISINSSSEAGTSITFAIKK